MITRNFRSNPIIKRLILSYTLYFKKPAANHWKHNKFFQYTITALCVGKHPDLSTWGENNPQRVDKSGCFPTQRAVIVLLYFCQCFIGYLPCGENFVVRRGTIELFPGRANFGKTSQLFYYHMTNLIQSKSII